MTTKDVETLKSEERLRAEYEIYVQHEEAEPLSYEDFKDIIFRSIDGLVSAMGRYLQKEEDNGSD